MSRTSRTARTAVSVLVLGLIAGCASTDVVDQSPSYAGDLTKPIRIVVYDFAAAPQDVPADSALAKLYTTRQEPQSAEELTLGRKLGGRSSELLVEELREMGIAAVRASDGHSPKPGDGVVRGAFVSVDEGSRWKRMLIGFGAGANELITIVEGYKMREDGLVPLGSAKIKAAGGKMPGVLVPVGVGAATERAATSAIIAGGANIAQEFGPESIEAAADRTAKQTAEIIRDAYRKRGWIAK